MSASNPLDEMPSMPVAPDRECPVCGAEAGKPCVDRRVNGLHRERVVSASAGIVGQTVEICGNRCRVLAVHFDPGSRSWDALCECEGGSLESVTLNYAQVVKP